MDCGIEYAWEDALALETIAGNPDRDEYIESFMKNYDMYYVKLFRPMMDSADKGELNGSDNGSTDWETLAGPSPFDESYKLTIKG